MGAAQQGAGATDGRWMMTARTLSFVTYEDRVLLIKRAPHKRIFPNQYNGLGGFIEANEDPYTSAKREIQEESGLTVHDLHLAAVHHINTKASNGIMLFVFTAQAASPNFVNDGREGTLEWVPIAALGEYDLVEDLPLILPTYLQRSATRFALVTYDEHDHIQLAYAEP